MPTLPKRIHINEEGPREGFQFEKGAIPTSRKIELIDALSHTGLDHIQIVSFVDPRRVPGMADAEEVVAGITPAPGVAYTGLWLNDKGFDRAVATGRLHIEGLLGLSASETFLKRNQNRTAAEQVAAQHASIEKLTAQGVPVERGIIMAAFGCNFEGDVSPQRVVDLTRQLVEITAAHGITMKSMTLADTMAWATPLSIQRVVGAVQDRFPTLELVLHLHDTRGMGIANAFAGLQMGITEYDAAVAGLGGCPFAGHGGAAGNVCTEDLVFMCEEMAIETSLDLEALIECARLAEDIVGHPLPGSVMKGGSLRRLREKLKAA
jgi:hydroxymethylglutaryl-CoA lyase